VSKHQLYPSVNVSSIIEDIRCAALRMVFSKFDLICFSYFVSESDFMASAKSVASISS